MYRNDITFWILRMGLFFFSLIIRILRCSRTKKGYFRGDDYSLWACTKHLLFEKYFLFRNWIFWMVTDMFLSWTLKSVFSFLVYVSFYFAFEYLVSIFELKICAWTDFLVTFTMEKTKLRLFPNKMKINWLFVNFY